MPARFRSPVAKTSDSVAAFDSAMVLRIVEALRRFGGESHRRFVIEHILRNTRGDRRTASLSAAIIACFERHSAVADDPDAVFRQRFGAGSHRWSLGRGAARVAPGAMDQTAPSATAPVRPSPD